MSNIPSLMILSSAPLQETSQNGLELLENVDENENLLLTVDCHD